MSSNWLFEDVAPEITAMADAALAEATAASLTRTLHGADAVWLRGVRDALGGRKFNAGDLGGPNGGGLYEAACEWLTTDEAKNHALPFVADIARKYARGGGLSDAQAAGILNCMTAQRPQRVVAAPISGQDRTRSQPLDGDDTSYDAWLEFTASAVGQGYYTVVLPDRRVTVRLGKWQADKRRPGEIMRWVSFLSGPDNESSYTVFALQQGDGKHRIMPAFRAAHGHLNTALRVLLDGGSKDAALEYAIESKRCARCNRLLTVPASVYSGFGPECIKHVGG